MAGSVSAISMPSWISETGQAIKDFITSTINAPQPYPYYRIEVKSPNGGEVWERNQTRKIAWQIYAPTYRQDEQSSRVDGARVSIDIYDKTSVPCGYAETCALPRFVKHIATVSMWDRSYNWRISDDIPNGKNYLVRISPFYLSALEIDCVGCKETPSANSNVISSDWDESDDPFEITGYKSLNLEEIIKSLRKIRAELLLKANDIQKLIELLEA